LILKIDMSKAFTNKSRGFTLIELLVVISIIALIASIILVSVGPARAKARDAKRQTDMKQISTAMELCYNDANCGGAKYKTHVAGANTWTMIDPDFDPKLLNPFPTDPINSGTQVYTWVAGNEQYYCIYTKLEAVADTWFCASNKGVKQKTYSGPPTKDDCCGMDVD